MANFKWDLDLVGEALGECEALVGSIEAKAKRAKTCLARAFEYRQYELERVRGELAR
jgi:hypothetical protein